MKWAAILLCAVILGCAPTGNGPDPAPTTVDLESCGSIDPAFKDGIIEISDSYDDRPAYDGWELFAVNLNDGSVMPALTWPCTKGAEAGQRVDSWYCGTKQNAAWRLYARKTIIDANGQIVRVERRPFSSEYDPAGSYRGTVCGGELPVLDESAWA